MRYLNVHVPLIASRRCAASYLANEEYVVPLLRPSPWRVLPWACLLGTARSSTDLDTSRYGLKIEREIDQRFSSELVIRAGITQKHAIMHTPARDGRLSGLFLLELAIAAFVLAKGAGGILHAMLLAACR